MSESMTKEQLDYGPLAWFMGQLRGADVRRDPLNLSDEFVRELTPLFEQAFTLAREGLRLRENPSVGICTHCGATLRQNDARITDERGTKQLRDEWEGSLKEKRPKGKIVLDTMNRMPHKQSRKSPLGKKPKGLTEQEDVGSFFSLGVTRKSSPPSCETSPGFSYTERLSL